MQQLQKMKTALIGSGMISGIYLKNMKEQFDILELVGCSDIRPERSKARAEEFGVRCMTNEEILADPSIEMVVNTTYPTAHFEVSKAALEAGKNVYCEKMTTLSVEQSTELMELAASKGLFVGGAPDTFLAGGMQLARQLLDSGIVGTPVAAEVTLCRSYHHERAYSGDYKRFAFGPNGGMIFDMGAYYLTALAFLLGPAQAVNGFSQIRDPHRTYLNPNCPLFGQEMLVESDNNTVGSVLYQNGTLGHLLFTSEGVGANQSFKLYCTNGTLDLGDPNEYGGVIRVTNKKGEISEIHTTHAYVDGNFRGLGVADAAYAIRNGRPARCSGEMNRHVLEMALGILESSATGQVHLMQTTCQRPQPFAPGYTERPELVMNV